MISFGKTASSYHAWMFGLILSRTKANGLSYASRRGGRRCSGDLSGRALWPASLVFPAWVTAIFYLSGSLHYRPGLFHSAHLRVAKVISYSACWPLLRDRATLAHGEWSGSCRCKASGSSTSRGSGRTLRTMVLGDLGADVLKVEHPERVTTPVTGVLPSPAASLPSLLSVNRNKRSIGGRPPGPRGIWSGSRRSRQGPTS